MNSICGNDLSILKSPSRNKPHDSLCVLLISTFAESQRSRMFSNDSNSCPDLQDLLQVRHLLRFSTSSTRIRGQGDVSSKKFLQISKQIESNYG